MIEYWESIKNRLHEESLLHHPNNEIGKMFETFFNKMLNQFSEDNVLFLDQGFLITTSGLYLDIRGQELGLPRREGTFAEGTVVFTLTKEIIKSSAPKKLENVVEGGITYDFRMEELQTLLDNINEERQNDEDFTTILEARSAENTFTIPQGTPVFSNVGFEYLLVEDVVFNKGDILKEGKIRAKESGSRYNAGIGEICVFNASEINKDLIVENLVWINDGNDGESDEEYARRLINNNSVNISVNFLKRQNIVIYSKKDVDDELRNNLTSFNPYLNNEYALIPPNNEISDYVLNELIINDWTVVYIKGW